MNIVLVHYLEIKVCLVPSMVNFLNFVYKFVSVSTEMFTCIVPALLVCNTHPLPFIIVSCVQN
jgi:hypothetical protein